MLNTEVYNLSIGGIYIALKYTKNTSFIYYAYEDGLPFFSYHKESALDNGVLFPAIFLYKKYKL